MATIQEQMAANSAAWKTATPAKQKELHDANLALAAQTGQSYNSSQGTYSAPTATPMSATKTNTNYVPVIGSTPDLVNGGNLTEYRAPRAGDTGIGVTPPSAPVEVKKETVEEIPKAVSVGNSYTPPDYAALAAARTAAALAQKRSIATTQKASLDRSFARDSQITNDNRTLENGQINRTLSPFSGKTAFDKGMIGRERTLVDENKSGNLAAQKAGIDDLLAAYESATADEQVKIMDELQARDRQYQLDLAQSTGNLTDLNTGQSQRTLQGQQFDWNTSPNNPTNIGQNLSNQGQALTNQLNELKLGNYPTEVKQQAQLFEQEYKTGKMTQETAEYNLKQLKDPNSPKNQADKIDLQLKQLDLKNAPEKARLEIQQLQKTIAQIGVVHYKPQTAAEIAQDKVTLATATKQLADIQKGIYPGDKPPATIPYKTNPKFAEDIAYIKSNPNAASMLDSNSADFINSYGYDGYKALREAAGLD